MTLTRARLSVAVAFVVFVWSMTTHGKFSNSGDEPHYLIVVESIVSDHDLDLTNNYANGDGRWVGADTLQPELHAVPNRFGALWTSHDIGLPILLVPTYAIATRVAAHVPEDWLARFRQTRGLFAYSLVSLALTVCTAWGLSIFLAGLWRVTTPTMAIAVTVALGFSPPVLSHAFLVFPETPAFIVTCTVVWLLCLSQDDEALTPGHVLAVVAAVGLMPWLHRKYSFYSLGLLALIAWQHRGWLMRQTPALRTQLLVLALVPQAALHVWTFVAWGRLGGPQMLGGLPFQSRIDRGAIGLLFDRERGLIAYAPIYLIAAACWAWTWRESRRLVIPVLLLFLPMAAYLVWGAGFSPAARYLVPLTPLLVLPAVRALDNLWIRRTAIVLAMFQAAIAVSVWNYPRALWPKELGTNEMLESIPIIGHAYSMALPSILTGDSTMKGWLIVAGLATTATIAWRRGQYSK